jgi:hypothetical protein
MSRSGTSTKCRSLAEFLACAGDPSGMFNSAVSSFTCLVSTSVYSPMSAITCAAVWPAVHASPGTGADESAMRRIDKERREVARAPSLSRRRGGDRGLSGQLCPATSHGWNRRDRRRFACDRRGLRVARHGIKTDSPSPTGMEKQPPPWDRVNLAKVIAMQRGCTPSHAHRT